MAKRLGGIIKHESGAFGSLRLIWLILGREGGKRQKGRGCVMGQGAGLERDLK